MGPLNLIVGGVFVNHALVHRAALARLSWHRHCGTFLVVRATSASASSNAHNIRFGATMNEPWRTLNDGVMGGLSQSELMLYDTSMRWTGQTRLENNGGFASIRAPWGHHDMRALNQAVVRCRGNGGPFKLTLENSQRWWMPYAYAEFDPSGEWQDIVLDLADFSWSQAQMGDLKRSTQAEPGTCCAWDS